MDPFYYRLEYRSLENAVLARSCGKLRDFIVRMAGGATPNKDEKEKYYTDSTGIPFVRVQNLSPEGLDLTDCVYINRETHETLLSRSRVKEHDLLVKITGVGRMAISSVAPEAFEGNINQHIALIQTADCQTSRLVAAYLNSDVGEKLASRRATGGTRPALDYGALRSIPVILDPRVPEIMEEAYARKQSREQEAAALLSRINDYLLEALGIRLREETVESLPQRLFYVQSRDVLGGRFDTRKHTAKYKQLFEAIARGSYEAVPLGEVMADSVSGDWGLEETAQGADLITCVTLRATEFDNRFNLNLENSRVKRRKYAPDTYEKLALAPNDILLEKSGGSEEQPVGRVALITEALAAENGPLAFSNFLARLRVKPQIADPGYVFEYLRLMHSLKVTEVMQTQTNGIRNLLMGEYLKQTVLLPPLEVQREIAAQAGAMRRQAFVLHKEAEAIVSQAKARVRALLLEETP